MAQDRYGDWRNRDQGAGQRRWPEGGREDFRGGEGRAFRPGEDRDERRSASWRRGDPGVFPQRDAGFDHDPYRRREFGRGPGRYEEDYAGPDLGGAFPERRGEARSFRGGEHRGHGPKGYRRSDARIRDDVCDRLADDPHLDARNIEVEVKSCEVILNGSVERREDKHRAEIIADLVSGVENVQNNLRAKSTTGSGGTA